MPNYVRPVGPIPARIAIVGEAPGYDEDRIGQPFVGSSGKFLTQLLSDAGIERNQCYITNVIKYRPPNNDFSIYYEDERKTKPAKALLQAHQDLIEELKRVRPNVTIAVGNEALVALTNQQGIMKRRGSVLWNPIVGKIVPTLHPAYVMRQYSSRAIVVLDLKKARKESKSPDHNPPHTSFTIGPTYSQVMEQLNQPMTRLAFDIETFGSLTRCLGLSWRPGQALCIPFIASPKNALGLGFSSPTLNSYWTEDQEYQILKRLDQIFRDPTVQKIAQNVAFDGPILGREFGLDIQNFWMDTMVAHHTLWPELPKNLDFLCSVYTDYPYYSDYDASDDRSTWVYNCFDCVATLETANRLEQELEDAGLDGFYFEHINPTLHALLRMQTFGVQINQSLREEMGQKFRAELDEIRYDLCRIADSDGFNPGSTQQVQKLLYDKLGLPVQKHPKTKRPTADKNAMAKLEQKYPHYSEIFQKITRYGSLSVMISNLIDQELGPDGRIYTQFQLSGTVTGRLSSSEPMYVPGTNLQNIPRGEPRQLFVADPGYVLLKCDLSQAEFRIVVWEAGITRIIERYQDPTFDIHTWNAAENIFKISIEKVTKEQRSLAKNGVYGANYRMRPRTAARTYKMPEPTAKLILDNYLSAFPELPAWWDSVERKINSTRTIRNPMGRRRIFQDRLDENTYRAAYSHTAQSLVADIINRAVTLADELFRPDECRPVLQVHDEIVFMCREKLVDLYVPRIREIMQYPIKYPGIDQPLVIPVEINVGPDWYNQKEVTHV